MARTDSEHDSFEFLDLLAVSVHSSSEWDRTLLFAGSVSASFQLRNDAGSSPGALLSRSGLLSEVTLTSAIIHPTTDAFSNRTAPLSAVPSAPKVRLCDDPAGLKIIDISEFYSDRGGGIRSHLTARSQLLAEQGHRHTVIASGPRDEETRSPAVGGSRVVRLAGPTLPYDRTYYLLHRIDKIRQRVRDERPDVLEAHSPYLATAAIVACGRGATRLRTAFWHSDHIGAYVEPALTKRVGERAARAAASPLRQGVRALLAPFDATFAAGREQVEKLRLAGVPRVIHAPFGVDTRVFRPSARTADGRREWLRDESASALLLVGCGRFAVEKRWDVVLDAFARIRARRRAVLVLFGDGPERGALERAAPPGVLFPGFERDRGRLATALASADALVHASPCETFGLGLAEAIACGLPIVVPNAGAAAERAGSACGAIYESLDSEACAAAVENLFEHSPVELRARALAAAADARTVDQHCRQVTAVYRELLRELKR